MLCELPRIDSLTSDIVWREIPLEYRVILNMEKEALFAVFKQAQDAQEEVLDLLVQDSSFVAF